MPYALNIHDYLPIKCESVIYEVASVSLNNLRISKGSRRCEENRLRVVTVSCRSNLANCLNPNGNYVYQLLNIQKIFILPFMVFVCLILFL
jgi:hypothetical protein